MMDPDDKFLADLHAKGKEKGLKILDADVMVTTPQGTVPMEDYGSFQPQFVPMFNRGEILAWNMSGDLGNGDKILGDWNPEHKGSLTSVCRNITARVRGEQAHPNGDTIKFSAPAGAGFAGEFVFLKFTEEEKKAMIEESERQTQSFLEEYKNAYISNVYIDSMPPRDPQTNELIVNKPRMMGKTMGMASTNQVLGRLKRTIKQSDHDSVIMTTGNWVEQAEAEMEVAKKIVNPKHQIRYKMPLPSLEAINANIADAWSRYIFEKRSRENVLKNHLAELKRMGDHELKVYINLARMRANTISGGKHFPSQLDMEKYVMALEEQDDRRREHYNKL